MDNKLVEYIESLPPLCHSLPFKFTCTDSGAEIKNLTAKCGSYGAEIHASNIRGGFTSFGQCAALKAYAICYKDRMITPIEARFGAGGELLMKGPEGWKQGRWGQGKRGRWFVMIKNFLRGGYLK